MGRSVFLLVALVLLCVKEGEPKVRACGPSLANVVNFVCDGNYAKPARLNPSKRTMDSDSEDADAESLWTPEEFGDPDPVMDHFLGRAQALRLLRRLPGRQRVRRNGYGLADECCHKSCTINEISAYCATNPQITSNQPSSTQHL